MSKVKNKNHKNRDARAVASAKRRAARRARWLTLMLVLFVIAALGAAYTLVLKPARSYMDADRLLEDKQWAKAEEAFKALGAYEDSGSKADLSSCMRLFVSGELDEAAVLYEQLSEDSRKSINANLGSFTALAEQAVEEGRYEEAYKYYSLDKENPESGDIMDSLDLYIQAEKLMQSGEYAALRELIGAYPTSSNVMSAKLQQLVDDSYEAQYLQYEKLSETDLNAAVAGMEALQDDYDKAASFLKDLNGVYEQAKFLYRQQKYPEAQKFFDRIGSYKDCAFWSRACDVMQAHLKAVEGDMDAAKRLLGSVYSLDEFAAELPEDSPLYSLLAEAV